MPAVATLAPPGVLHRRRLRDVYRSAGWPCHDAVEVDLLAGGLLERVASERGCETLRLTDAGLRCLAETHAAHRARRDAHEALVARVAAEMTKNGRLAWRGLVVRARTEAGWHLAMPDVYSIRHTTVEAYLEPVVHEVKVRRSDLVADLRKPAKRAAYLDLGACWYVIADGIAEPDEIPGDCGVLVACGERLQVARAAERRPARMAFGTWMALARATPVDGFRLDEAQLLLGDEPSPAAREP